MPCKHRPKFFSNKCRYCNTPLQKKESVKNKIMYVTINLTVISIYVFDFSIDWIEARGLQGKILVLITMVIVYNLMYLLIDYEPEINDDEKQGDDTGEDAEQ